MWCQLYLFVVDLLKLNNSNNEQEVTTFEGRDNHPKN